MGVRLPSRAARRTAAVAAAPAFAGALVAAFGAGGALGRFHVGLALLVSTGALLSFVGLTLRQAVASIAFGAVLGGGLLLAVGAGAGQALAGVALLAGLGIAAQGLRALATSVGTGQVAAGAIAFGLLVVGMTGLVWADPVAERLPRTARWPVRQAVLHLDPATAMAYDAAGYDRLLDATVYATVPLASTSIERPRALVTAALWGALGLLAAGSAWALSRGRASGPRSASIAA